MELRHLRYFVAVAEEGSLTGASRRLGIQQPPLGQQIKALEDEIGVQLFDRLPKRLALNEAGRIFLDDAKALLESAREAVDHVRRFERGECGRLAVGFTSSASIHALTPRVLQAFRAAYPEAGIQVEERESYELVLGLQQRRLDAAFLHVDTTRFPDLECAVLAEEDMVAAIPSGHPMARAAPEPMTLDMLEGQELVIYRRADGPGIFEGILAALSAAGVRPVLVDEVQRLIAAVNLVAAGRGISLVPASVGILHRDSIVYRRVSRQSLPPLPLYVAYRRANRLELVRNFIATTIRLATP